MTQTQSDTATIAVDSDDETDDDGLGFRLARLLFGGVMVYQALTNFRDLDAMIGYAESKDAPMPETSVPAISGTLLFGGLGIAFWKLPTLAAGAVVTFLGSITPVLHDFWNVDDEQERQQEESHFTKNVALIGGALAFMRIARKD